MEQTWPHQTSTALSSFSKRVVQSGTYDMPDLQLHTKSEDHEMDLQDMSVAYETEIEQMLSDAASKINTFKNQLEGVRDDTRFKEAVKKVEERYRNEKQDCLAEISSYKQRMEEREIAIQNAAKKQMMEMESHFDGLGKKLDGAAEELAQVKQQSTEHETQVRKQIAKAKEETEEAIQAGNHRYNSMLHDNMNKQDDLNRMIDSLKLDIAAKAAEARDLETKMSLQCKDSEEARCRQLKAWEEERGAAAKQRDQEEKMWHDRLQDSTKQAEEHRMATLAANRRLGSVQAELIEVQDKLSAETLRSQQLSAAVADSQKQLQSMTSARDDKEQALQQQHSVSADLRQQLTESESKHANALKSAGDEGSKLATQIQQLTEDLMKARTATKDAEQATVKALQQLQKTSGALESRSSELQDTQEQVKQLQAALSSEVAGRSADKTAAHSALQQQIAAKDRDLTRAAEQVAAAEEKSRSLQEAGKKHSAQAQAALLEESAERLSQAQTAHSEQLSKLQREHEKTLEERAAKQKVEVEALQKVHAQELARAAEAADGTLLGHMDTAAKDLQAAEASWAAKASDLQEQATQLQSRAKELESECDMLRQKQEAEDSVTARKLKDAEGKNIELQEEVNSLQHQNAELQKRLQDLAAENVRLEDTCARAQSEATMEEDSLRETISDLTQIREKEKQEAQQLLDNQRSELESHWKCRMDQAVSDALSAADRAHQHSLNAQESGLQATLQQKHEASVNELKELHSEELKNLQEALDQHHQHAMIALQQKLDSQLLDVKSSAQQDLQAARQCSESANQELREAAARDVAAAEQQHAEQVAVRQKAHDQELRELREQHVNAMERLESQSRKAGIEAAQVLLKEKQCAANDIKKLQDAQREAESAAKLTQTGLKRKLDQTQEKLEQAVTERDKLASDLAALETALAKKVLELQNTMDDTKVRHEHEISSLKSKHVRETEAAETTHCRRIAALKATLEDVTAESEEKYDNLSQAYGELKLAWDNRGAREQDVERINGLLQMVQERDQQIEAFDRRYNELRNEMLLREDNYNNHFANGGLGKQVLGVDRALSSGNDVASWMLRKNSSFKQRSSSSARPGAGPRASID